MNWLDDDEINERKTIENKISLLKPQLSNVEQKLDRLLTGYLDQVIETDEYQTVKKKLIDEKTNFEEQISSFEKNQFLWVELVRDFINSALEAHKIARAKNNGEELSFFAKKVGSNYFLSGRHLKFSPLRGFNALAAPAPAASSPLSLHDLRRGRDSNPRAFYGADFPGLWNEPLSDLSWVHYSTYFGTFNKASSRAEAIFNNFRSDS